MTLDCKINDYKNDYIQYLQQNKKASDNTLAAYSRDVGKFCDYVESCGISSVSQINVGLVSGFKADLNTNGFSSSSISRTLSAVRSFFQFLMLNGVLKTNPAKEVHSDKLARKAPSILTSKEIELLLAQPSINDPKGRRDRAILELLYATGLKVSELVSLNVSDFNPHFSTIRCAKGKHERYISLYQLASNVLLDYVTNTRKLMLLKPDEEALFVNVAGERMTRQGLWKIIRGYAMSAKIYTSITPHTLRNSFAAHLLENGADIHDIQEILGHSDISSTQRYAHFLKDYHKKEYVKFHPRA